MDKTAWKRTQCRITDDGDILEQWEYSKNALSYLVGINRFYSEWGASAQVTILKKSKGVFCEPSMSEKNAIFKYTKAMEYFDDPVPFEIFPIKSNIVDRIDAYHTWTVERKEIPFYVKTRPPCIFKRWRKVCINGKWLMYTRKKCISEQHKIIFVYFIKSAHDVSLRWYDKQNFKDAVIGENVLAIEPIVEDESKFSILICAPKDVRKLPFGLK